METVTRLFFRLTGDQPPKSDTNDCKPKIDIEGLKRSDFAQGEEMSQAKRITTSEGSKALLLEKTDEISKMQQRYNELSHTHRLQQLDKREVAETKKLNVELKETLQKRSEGLQELQERYGDLLQKHKARTDEIGELVLARKTADGLRETVRKIKIDCCTHQEEMTVLKDILKGQEADLEQTIRLRTVAEQKCKQLHSELETAQEHLQVCKDDLFRLQPMAQLPDTEIVKEFESICQDIISWIDVEISAFEKSYPSTEPGQIFSGGQIPEFNYLLEQHPTFGEYLVRFVVHQCLYDTMFSRSVYLLGLPTEIKQYLQAAEKRMASLEPPRDFKTINEWRSETLRAFAATPDLARAREAKMHHIGEQMFEFLSRFFPIIRIQAQSKQRLLNEVVLPAANLASKIQVSASLYDFRLPKGLCWNYEPVIIDDHKTMKMIDVKTRKTIKGPSTIDHHRDRRFGDIVIHLEPSIWRINQNEEMTFLRPEVNLIQLDQPLAKRLKASS